MFFGGFGRCSNDRAPENQESASTQSMRLGFLRHRLVSVAIIAAALVGSNNLPAISELELQDSNPASTGSPTPHFEERILPILQVNCVRCHDSQTKMAGLDLSSREGLFKGSASGRVLVAGEPKDSRLLEVIQEGLMPADGRTRLSDEEIETIRAWIERLGGAGVAEAESGLPDVTHHDIVPIMLLHCTACHGERYQEGGLDLRNRASMLKGGKSGPAMVLGKPDDSLILKLVREGEMPPNEREVEANVRTMRASEIDLLERWITLGAPEAPTAEVERSGNRIDASLGREAQPFWAFQSVPEVEVPKLEEVEDRARVRNPIDAFIVRKLDKRGLSLSPEADPLTLIRRAYFDLTGLPPEPEEVERFLADKAPHAYEKLIDRLLASRRYGERWARYWLDLAGYEDWPHAYRYRDYVIRSFHADKPYDRFLQEQIAGDELADYESVQVVDQGIMDNLVATGFLRMAPDSTGVRLTNFVKDRVQVISDEIAILSSSVLSLTVQCARCHDHKFDPISQSDYYRLAATLKGAFDEHDWLPPKFSDDPNRPALVKESRLLPYVTPLANPLRLDTERRKREANNDKLRKEIGALRAVLEEKAKPLKENIISRRLAKVPQVLHEDLRKMLDTPSAERSEFQKYLAEKFEESFEIHAEELNAMDAGYRKAAEEMGKRIKVLQSRVLPEPRIRALWDRGKPSPTYVLRRGEPMSPGRWVQPGVPAFLAGDRIPFEVKPPWTGAQKTGRRLALARWLTHPDHPLTARVMANRIWKHHFGRGIVQTLGNFGHTGARPTHPELLDWLAGEFMQLGWSMKAMHRLIMTSATYRQTSTVGPTQSNIDPDNLLLSRMPMRRMEAEVLRDTLFVVAGRLNETPFGPADPVQEREDGLATSIGGDQGWRRSIYIEQHNTHRRGQSKPTILEKFDFPQMTPNCVERVESTAVPQALHLLNNRLVHDLSESFASRVKSEVGSDPQRQIERAYLIALSRPPGDDEKSAGLEALTELGQVAEQRLNADQEGTSIRPLAKFCHTLINSAGFIFID